jgi:hypothetical protein
VLNTQPRRSVQSLPWGCLLPRSSYLQLNLRVLLNASGEAWTAGRTVARLWMATTAELARSGSLVVVGSSSVSASVGWRSLVSSSCISPGAPPGVSSVSNAVTGTGVVVTGGGVEAGRRLGKLYFLTRSWESSSNPT